MVRNHGDRKKALSQPCVVISPAGMLVGGNAVYYLQELALDEKNGIAMVSYQGEGTPGKKLLETGIISARGKDTKVKATVKQYPGLRITRQDPFQCCISFIISANSNIPNIKMRLQKLCRKFGTRVNFDKKEFFVFPKPRTLADASINDLQECGLGYRTKYVKDTSFFVDTGEIDFDYLKKADYQTAKESLLKLPGIGDKVADCIMLFSLEKLEAFPLDTWILKILQKYYSDKFHIEEKLTKKKYENTRQQILNHFGMYSGYSQQFLFKMERDLNEKKWL